MPAKPENPFIYGEPLTETAFVDREEEADQLERDLTDAQKVFLLSPRRFGKSTLLAAVFRRLEKRGVRTATVPVSNYTTYTEFLEGVADTVLRAAGPYDGSATVEITSSQRRTGDQRRWERDQLGAVDTPQRGRVEGRAP